MKPAQVHNALGMVVDLYGSMLTQLAVENAQLQEQMKRRDMMIDEYARKISALEAQLPPKPVSA